MARRDPHRGHARPGDRPSRSRASFENSAKKTVSPAIDLALAGILLLAVLVLATGPHERTRARRARRKKDKKPPSWQRALRKGTLPIAFVIGVLLSFPGASYLAALDRLGKLHYSTVVTVLVVIGFCLVQLVLLEGPIVAFRIAPEKTPIAIERAKAWARAHWRKYAVWGVAVIAALLAIVGVVELL